MCEAALEADRCGHCGAAARAGPYTIRKLLSQNAQGRVYLAVDEAGAEVALKELVYTMVPSVEELEAFARETRLLEELSHPQIPRFVKGFTVGQGANTRLYLAQQLVRGESLEQKLAHHRFSEDEVRDLARQVLEILAWLNERRPPIVHRDLKPANLIVSPEGKVHLIDFGTARDVKSGGTHRSTLVGTVGYMAPEQLGGTVSHQSDLYGLGATLAHLLTRSPPEQLTKGGLSIDAASLDASAGLRGFLRGLLAARPSDRYADARQALTALDAGVRLNTASRQLTLVAIATSLALALALGLLLVVKNRSESQAAEAPPAETTPPPQVVAPLPPEPPPAERDQPRLPVSTFGWQVADWDFTKPGPWLLDATGHLHSAPFPRTGYTVDFFGPVWDGSQKVVLSDAPAFAFEKSFHIEVAIGRGDGKNKLPAPDPKVVEHLITRGDPNGRYAFDLALQGDVLRFSLMDADGKSVSVEAPIKVEGVETTFYAQWAPNSGELSLYRFPDCKPLKVAVSDVKPAHSVPSGKVTLIDGFRGRVRNIKLTRGRNLPQVSSAGASSCSYGGVELTDGE